MAKKVKQYAKVLAESLAGVEGKEAEKKVQRFIAALKKRGDLRLLGNIVLEFEKAWEERRGVISRLVSAKELPRQTKETIVQSLSAQGYQVKEELNEDVVGGTAVFLGNSYLVDNTIKGKLKIIQRLFQ